ncbi:hypothetical protein AB8881_10775 [Alphaproteobacteria bacterium LSUCC0396]
MKTLFCFYDLAVSPCSYDFFTFLYSAEICRIRRGLSNIKLIFVHGPNRKFREDNIRTFEQNELFFNNVIIPGISVLPSCESFIWEERQGISFQSLAAHNIFPRGYTLNQPTSEYVAHELVASLFREDSLGFFEAPSYARKIAEQITNSRTGGAPYVTLTVREIDRDNANNTRTIKYDVWSDTITKLKERGIETIVVRDTSHAFCPALFSHTPEAPEASVHLPTRLALYENALLNFTKNNGPVLLLLYSKARTMAFNSFDDDVIALSKTWFSSHYGMNHGDQFPMTTKSKKYVWDDETSTTIIQGVDEAMDASDNNIELNNFTNIENVKSSLTVAWHHLASQLCYGLMPEDILLFKRIKAANTQFKLFDSVERPLLELAGEKLSQEVVEELFAKSDEA